MPVRIYDLAKKLGVESKEVLAKAKELGIAAKVPSSSLDKITAEFLEQTLAASLVVQSLLGFDLQDSMESELVEGELRPRSFGVGRP